MKETAVVIPVCNRRETTLRCLQTLRAQEVPQWASVIVVDDGSSDGTGEAVRSEFPETSVLEGDGSLWWGGAINLGMRHALEAGCSQVIWLNDDCLPEPGSLENLLEASRSQQAITVAPCKLEETGSVHYAGLRRTRYDLEMVCCDEGAVLPCDTVCGNCVCVPRQAIESVGLIDAAHFPHAMGDADYGLRASHAGIPILVVGSAPCSSSYGSNSNRESWLLGRISIAELWRNSRHATNGWLTPAGLRFRLRHWGWRGLAFFGATLARLVVTSVIRLLIPQAVLRRLLGGSSTHYQLTQKVRTWEQEQQPHPPPRDDQPSGKP